MSEPSVTVNIDERGVATLMLNRPQVHNAFDDRLIAGLTHELRELERDAHVRVVVLGGEGKSFSAGADLNWMQRMAKYSEADNIRDAVALANLMRVLDTMSKPTIARVQGAAFGGGVGLVACCDTAIAGSAAVFCLSEVRLGLIPAVISPYVVAAMGQRNARRYFLTAERFDAQEALRIGLVHAVVDPAQLDERLTQMIEELLKGGPRAIAAAKDLIASVANRPVDQTLAEDTAARIAQIRVSAEGQEGTNAFLEKRAAAWVKGKA
jgi:methylglutaconyl-CoA hydratase